MQRFTFSKTFASKLKPDTIHVWQPAAISYYIQLATMTHQHYEIKLKSLKEPTFSVGEDYYKLNSNNHIS